MLMNNWKKLVYFCLLGKQTKLILNLGLTIKLAKLKNYNIFVNKFINMFWINYISTCLKYTFIDLRLECINL